MSGFQPVGVSFEEFQDIVEGRNKCPTIKELNELAQQTRAGTAETQSPILQHLEKCTKCRDVYDQFRV